MLEGDDRAGVGRCKRCGLSIAETGAKVSQIAVGVKGPSGDESDTTVTL